MACILDAKADQFGAVLYAASDSDGTLITPVDLLDLNESDAMIGGVVAKTVISLSSVQDANAKFLISVTVAGIETFSNAAH